MRCLTQKEDAAALFQLASRISPVMKCGPGAGEDPSAQVKELITNSIKKLQSDASSEAKRKSHRVDELTKAGGEKVDPETQVATHSSKLETDVSKSGEVA